ncbi:MAG: hypothetical protein ACKJSK_10115 [Roseibacillus sp.]
MDRFSTWLIWGSAIFVALGVCAINTVAVIPWVLVGMLCGMGGSGRTSAWVCSIATSLASGGFLWNLANLLWFQAG